MPTRNDDHDVLAKLTSSLPPAKIGRPELLTGLWFLSCLAITFLFAYRGWDWSAPINVIDRELNQLELQIEEAQKPTTATIEEGTDLVVMDVVEPPLPDTNSLQLVTIIPPPSDVEAPGKIGAIAFRPGQGTLAVSEDSGYVRLYDPANGSLLRRFSERTRDYARMAFSSKGTLLAAASRGGIYCWRADDGELAFSSTGYTFTRFGERVHGVLSVNGNIAFSDDGNFLAVCTGSQVVIMSTVDGSTMKLLGPKESSNVSDGYEKIRCLCFANGSNDLYMGSWHSKNRTDLIYGWTPGMDEIDSVAWLETPASMLVSSPDGSRIAMQTDDGEIRVLFIAPAGPPGTGPGPQLKVPSGHSNSLTFSSDGRFLFAGGSGNRIRCWKLDSDDSPMTFTSDGTSMRAGEQAEGPSVTRIATSDDGTLLACGCSDRHVRIFRLDSMPFLSNAKTGD